MARRGTTAKDPGGWTSWSRTQRKAGHNSTDDSSWAEVKHINCYATFMGYLWITMRGLSVLVVTWTTVVLLGGFVSMLEKKDFWCLTVITLVQTAGVFNMHLRGNLTAIPTLCLGFLYTMKITVTRKGGQVRSHERACMPCLPAPSGSFSVKARNLMGFVLEFVQGMVFAIILCPLAAFYGFGQYITSACSVWRLIERDYGNSDGDAANKIPALYVLYTLAVFQGTVFLYRVILGRAGKRIAKQVAEEYMFEDHSPVLGYLEEVRIGCEKHPSFGRGRNLITYALDLMELDSPDELLSGTRVLDTLITYDEFHKRATRQEEQKGTRTLMVKQRLIGSSSSRIVLYKLLRVLDSRRPSDAEMRKHSARILCALAGEIHLEQVPGVIEDISSLLYPSLEEVHQCKEFMLQGLLIIEKLSINTENCRVISDTRGLLYMIMSPLSSDLLHRFKNHDAWSGVVDASLRVLCCLLTNIAEQHREHLCDEIGVNLRAINAMQSILTCSECDKSKTRRVLAIKVLITQLHKGEENPVLQVQLLHIFIHYKNEEYITTLAGEELVTLSRQSKSNAEIILQGNIGSVQEIISSLCIKGQNKFRICAAGILEGLCSHYIATHESQFHLEETEQEPDLEENGVCLENLKGLIINFMPELLLQIFPAHRQREIYGSPDIVDIEMQNSPVSPDNAQNVVQPEDKKLQAALLSLCLTVYDNMINEKVDLPLLHDAVCCKDAEFNLPNRLGEIVERNSHSMEVDCLTIVKHAAMMTKSVMRHKHIYRTEHLDRLMNSLDNVCLEMSHLDAIVDLCGGHGGDTLISLVQEAHKLFHPMEEWQQPEISKKGKESEFMEPSLGSREGGDTPTSLVRESDQLFHPTEERQEAEDIKKGKESEITEPSAPSTFEYGQSSSS